MASGCDSDCTPLLGLGVAAVSMVENHLAWARFLELAARRRPLILAVEDLHWADDALLGFCPSSCRPSATYRS